MIFSKAAHAAPVLAACAVSMGNADKVLVRAAAAELGVASLSRFGYSSEASVDEECMYTLTMMFSHDEDLPVGDAVNCDMGVIADDGLPYLAPRTHYKRFPSYVSDATGFDHVSIDFGPCGHPSQGWASPHYDVHVYTVDVEYRKAMTCVMHAMAPVCDPPPAVQDDSGAKFFAVGRELDGDGLTNMPPGYVVDIMAAVPHQGVHTFAPEDIPENPTAWDHPSMVFLSYDEKTVCVEPMFALALITGDEDKGPFEYEMDLVDQTQETLPTWWSYNYDGQTKKVTLVYKGKSAVCKAGFETAREASENPPENLLATSAEDNSSLTNLAMGTVWAASMVAGAAMSASL